MNVLSLAHPMLQRYILCSNKGEVEQSSNNLMMWSSSTTDQQIKTRFAECTVLAWRPLLFYSDLRCQSSGMLQTASALPRLCSVSG